MRKVMAISALCTVLGYAAVHFAFFGTPEPQPQEPAVQASAEPVMLANVVEVTDTDSLLDPRPAQAGGVPFDAEPVAVRAPSAAEPIPPAAEYEADEDADEVEVAPMPHEARARKPLDAARVAWYGDQVIPRQVTEGMNMNAPAFDGGIGFYF